ncbi:MAG TPA: secretin N-terminal domain-containing protein [Chthonomonadales bacterium]|nr:secretin N-terminal domain-containing protein [Chthonomonadales bacterium]
MGLRCRTASLMCGSAAAALALGLASFATPARAQETTADPRQTVVARINLAGADLRAAVQLLMSQTGAEIVVESSDRPYGRVDINLENKPLETVLRLMCLSAGASLRTENGVFVIGPRRDPEPEAPRAAPAPEPVKVTPPQPRRVVTEKIRLHNTRPGQILSVVFNHQDRLNAIEDALLYDGVIASRRAFDNFNERSLAMQTRANAGGGQGVAPEVPTSPSAQAPIAPTAGASVDEAHQFRRGGMGGGMGGGQFGGMGGGQFGGMGGQFGGMGGQLGGMGGQLGGMGGQVGAAAGNLFPNIERIFAFDADNSIIVRGDPVEVAELRELIRMLDIQQRQVMIQAQFVTVRQDDLRTFGIDWHIARGTLTAGTGNTFAAGDIFVNYATGNIVNHLRATITEGRGRLINAPMVTTMNNVGVSIQVGRFVPIITTGAVAGWGGGAAMTQTQVTFLPVQTSLFVIPRINNDNTITLIVTPQLSDIVAEVANPAGGTLPIVTEQTIQVSRRVRDGDTIVIGGLQSKNERTSARKVPILGDLPIIGSLFRTRSTTVADEELLIFVTASVIPDPGGDGVVVGGAGEVPQPR